jgi:hypothetical protein
MSMGNTTTKKNLFKGSKVWFFLAGAAAVIGAVFVFVVLQNVTATTTYYVLNKDIPARTLITEDLLSPVTTSQGGEPRTALTPGDLAATGELYSKYSLDAGDTVTPANAGSLVALTAGLPEDYVLASFTADPSVAAGGRIERGTYVDLIANDGENAHVFLQRVLVVDATISLSGGETGAPEEGTTTTDAGTSTETTASAAEGSANRLGVPTLFTVGVSQADAVKLAVSANADIYVVLSSADSVSNGAQSADVGVSLGDLFAGETGDSGLGTDNTFGLDDEDSEGTTTEENTPAPAPSESTSDAPTTGTDEETTTE